MHLLVLSSPTSTAGVTEAALLGVVALVTIVAAGVFSKKLGIAAPLLLILIGFGFSFLPGAPVKIPHEIILYGLLPPILYSAAINIPVLDFRRNLSSITALSVLLVIVTAVGTGVILWALFPQLSLAAGIAIGAVISPTDAVAATARSTTTADRPSMSGVTMMPHGAGFSSAGAADFGAFAGFAAALG